jgi:peptide/nickel transport system permease protein
MDLTFLPTWTSGGWSPGWLLDRLWHLVLPVICLSYANLAFLSKLTRGALLDTIKADFVRTAKAKGLPEGVVLFRHAFRNSLIPLITYLGSFLPALLSGSVIVETVFGINGMGKLFVDAISQKDQELLLSLIVVSTVLSIAGTLLADLLNVVADPRVSYE